MDAMYPRFHGLQLLPTRAALTELMECNLTLLDALDILENGYNCAGSKRKKNKIENCLDKGKKTLKVVVVQVLYYSLDEEIWHITHVGCKTKRK